MEDYQPDYGMIIQFIEGEALQEDAEKIIAWIKRDKNNEELYFRIKDIIDYFEAQNTSPATKEKWEEIVLLLKKENDENVRRERSGKRFRIGLLKYAAILVVIGGAFLLYYYSGKTSGQAQLIIQVPFQELARRIVLPDSSRVWVKGGSSLRYNENFASGQRSVWLAGTAFFEVSKRKDDKHRPRQFVVHTENATVTVLGTSFTVDQGKEGVSVIVNTGLVKASVGNREVLLRPSDRLQANANTFKQDRVNPGLYAAWKDGDYQFDKTSIDELKSLIETIYNYKVTVHHAGKLKCKKISGRITVSDETTLWEALSLLLQANVIKQDRQIIIDPK